MSNGANDLGMENAGGRITGGNLLAGFDVNFGSLELLEISYEDTILDNKDGEFSFDHLTSRAKGGNDYSFGLTTKGLLLGVHGIEHEMTTAKGSKGYINKKTTLTGVPGFGDFQYNQDTGEIEVSRALGFDMAFGIGFTLDFVWQLESAVSLDTDFKK